MKSKHLPSDDGPFGITPRRFQPRSYEGYLFRRKGMKFLIVVVLVCVVLFFHQSLPFSLSMFSFAPALNSAFSSSSAASSAAAGVSSNVHEYDMGETYRRSLGINGQGRVLFCVPLRNAESHMKMFFGHLQNLTYPHRLIDLAFLVSDSDDNTLKVLQKHLVEAQGHPDESMRFGEITILLKDFGAVIGQDFSDRHGFAAQGPRRKLMARARNWLLTATLKPYHSWVYWRDADVETAPATILEDLMRHNKDVIVPNVWRPLPDWLGNEQPYDLNSWQESDVALQLAATLGEDDVIVEGYEEYATWRPHLAYLRDEYGDPSDEMPLDGIGGVSILAKSYVFFSGCHFPAFSFERHAETEGFGKMARKMGYSVVGLPHYVIWHIYEPSDDDLRHMAEMERQEQEARERERAAQAAADKTKGIVGSDDGSDEHGSEQGPLAHINDEGSNGNNAHKA
ncbi:anp family mannosyltransferase complex subunit [Schizosaccharomyces japonicus yFS275]|uniref:Anp family mannosyltransferase complex subunit n=1 Tax=Schizosaccharomyces japonicus (strain yFS275 / FY16936) TaxID=402676 RepID=B6JWN9_SCHJY|nr:anp family mannosyltransferase complex subunit [Schizosaccharomyces japonicus yFS275]EEB05790.1 anp family mannosyltransferase complex subunit [Schizosaccharomyces japonicus yFS275]